MSEQDELFFTENVVNVNRMVRKVMAATVIVPLSFIILTHIGIWSVSYNYSMIMLGLSVLIYLILLYANKNPKLQVFSMYFGILSAVLYVDFLGYNRVVQISITYGCAPFLSCLYYNKKLTNLTSIFAYLSIVAVHAIQAFGIGDFIAPVISNKNTVTWFIGHVSGITIEYVFVFLIAGFLASRNYKTIQNLVKTKSDRDAAYDKLSERNKYIMQQNLELESANRELNSTQYKIIQFVAQCLGKHDIFTGFHVMHTKKFVEIIAKELRDEGYYEEELTDKNIALFSTAAFLHDIGKIHVPEGILNKMGPFTPAEYEMMKCHPKVGKELLEYLPPIEGGKFNDIAIMMAYHHHEKWDGSGYPNGLSGEQIPLCARIMTAADSLDAMISQRLYKDPLSVDEAMDVFEKCKGSHFEPCIADAVINCKHLITLIDQDFKTSEASENAKELEWWHSYHENLKL
ncbi:MAG: HD domain-containing protein [Treponema sp.]|nr:HD domain-containing protein [Treponema sp.]